MMHQFIKISLDAVKMVKKNIKTYILLSVTLVLTFSIFGIFMFASDSQMFYMNKEYIKVSPNVSFIEYYISEDDHVTSFKSQLEKMKDTYSCTTMELIIQDDKNHILKGDICVKANIHAIYGKELWAYYYDSGDGTVSTMRMQTVRGEKSIRVEQGEVVISRTLYDIIKKQQEPDEDGYYYVNVPYGYTMDRIYKNLKIVDVVEDSLENSIYDEENKTVGEFDFFVSMDDFSGMNSDIVKKRMVVMSPQNVHVLNLATKLELNYNTPMYDKLEAYQSIRNMIYIKAAITIAILILLGINLYSCFSNALDERKFEIGVKRAIGASKINIIFQFFIEGMLVMTVDLIISIAIVTATLTAIKLAYLLVLSEQWSIIVYNHTILIYLICCIFMSVFFSILFSYMTTRVEVVKYLKGE